MREESCISGSFQGRVESSQSRFWAFHFQHWKRSIWKKILCAPFVKLKDLCSAQEEVSSWQGGLWGGGSQVFTKCDPSPRHPHLLHPFMQESSDQYTRDVNLPLFGGIPLFFGPSSFFKIIFRFFFKSPEKNYGHRNRWESSAFSVAVRHRGRMSEDRLFSSPSL